MSWVRGVLLLAAAVPLLAVLGVVSDEMAPAGRRVLVSAVALWLAPLFWPGSAERGAGTVQRVLGWSLCVTALAGLAMLGLARGGGGLAPIVGLLLVSMVIVHGLVAWGQGWLQRRGRSEALARQVAGQAVSTGLLALGAAPLAAGPMAQLLWQQDRDGLLDTLMAISPLTHLAVAADFDLLRADWLYRHSNLAALPVAYPDARSLVLPYGVACAALAVWAWRAWRRDPARMLA